MLVQVVVSRERSPTLDLQLLIDFSFLPIAVVLHEEQDPQSQLHESYSNLKMSE